MLVLFDNEGIHINIRAGALETYAPTQEIVDLVGKTDILRKRMEDKHQELAQAYERFIKDEINPVRQEIVNEVDAINKRNHPGIK